MVPQDFISFTKDYELLVSYFTVHDLRGIYNNIVSDAHIAASIENLSDRRAGGGGGGRGAADGKRGKVPSEFRAQFRSRRSRVFCPRAGEDLSYREFLEFLASISCFVVRNPYLTVHDRLDKFVVQHLKSRPLPSKSFRTARQ